MTAQSSPEPSSPPAPAAAASPQVTIPLQPVVSVPVPATATPAAPVTKKPVLHERVTHKHAKALLEQMTADEIRTQLGTVGFFLSAKNKQTNKNKNKWNSAVVRYRPRLGRSARKASAPSTQRSSGAWPESCSWEVWASFTVVKLASLSPSSEKTMKWETINFLLFVL